MASLLDIVPLTTTVSVNGTEITVRGVGIDAIACAMSASPDLAALMRPGGVILSDPASLLMAAPAALHGVIAEACGMAGDAAALEVVRTLPFHSQVDLVEAIIKLSFPGGVLPFVPRLTGLLGSVPTPAAAAAPAVNGTGGDLVEPVTNGAPQSTN